MRSITLYIDWNKLKDIPHGKIEAAIGRLALWAVDTYPTVTIATDRDQDLVASYHNTELDRHFTIGAIWQNDAQEYTFHS